MDYPTTHIFKTFLELRKKTSQLRRMCDSEQTVTPAARTLVN